jgi:hypothetical protein
MARYWRIRLKNQDGEFGSDAWERDQTGVWYGAWAIEDFRNASSGSQTNEHVADVLNNLPAQMMLIESGAWGRPIQNSSISTVRRFVDQIAEDDWVVMYLRDERGPLLALAQMEGIVYSDPNHPLNTQAGEIFKYRTLRNKKTFALSELPDAYRLVPTQGQGNVHQFDVMHEHVRLLVEHYTPQDIISYLSGLPFDRQLDLMGASGWESLCVSWLIMEKDFVPTGLSTGRTLQTLDIVGRSRSTGRHILAQCKKSNNRISMDDGFINCIAQGDEGYYFAYGGCDPVDRPEIQVIDRSYLRDWIETENGQLFRRLFIGDQGNV